MQIDDDILQRNNREITNPQSPLHTDSALSLSLPIKLGLSLWLTLTFTETGTETERNVNQESPSEKLKS
jgi:hypothetical protein